MNPNANGHDTITPSAGAIVRQGFGETELQVQAEMQGIALAAQVKAQVEARYIMALKKPRSYDQARRKLLEACARPGFADAAIFSKPMGKKQDDDGKWVENTVEGLSIRFVEEALRSWGNVHASDYVTFDDTSRRTVHVVITDLEANSTFEGDITVDKTVERSNAKGRIVLSERDNSYGKKTYTVLATEDEVQTKLAAQLSKKLRNLGLRLIPGDLLTEARSICEKTLAEEIRKDLPAKRKGAIAWFAEHGVSEKALADYLGHSVEQATADELMELGRCKNAIAQGEAKWDELLDAKRGERGPSAPPPAQTSAPAPAAAAQAAAEAKPATSEAQASPAPAAAPADPTDALLAEMRAAKTLRDLSKLSARKATCPEARHAEILQVYQECRDALTAGEPKK